MKKQKIKTRDWALVRIIQGATKSGVHQDHKKEKNKKACRHYEYNGDEDMEEPASPSNHIDTDSPPDVESSTSQEAPMKNGIIVFHKRLDKGPGVVVEVWTDDDGRFVKVFWQRDLVELTHPALSLTMLGDKDATQRDTRRP